jgi:parallel beta-helix repeat protein
LRWGKRSRVALGAVLAFGLLAAVPAAVLAAQPTCGQTLTTNTTLTADLDCSGYGGTALTMGAKGIVLNLNGHTIWGPAGNDSLYGVYSDGYNRTTIKNGSIQDFYIGVYLNGSNRTLVQNVDFASDNTTTDYGVYIDYGVKNTLNDLETDDVYYGVFAEDGAKLTVKNSDLSGDSSGGAGLYLYYETGDTVSNNQLHGNYGVRDEYSNKQTYTGNMSNGNYYGLYLYCDGYGTVNASGNTTNGNYYGIYAYECYVVDHPLDGFIGSRFTGNTANENGYGYYAYYSMNELWRGNTANDNSEDGLYYDYPIFATITYNVTRRNGDSGIELNDNNSWYNVNKVSYNTSKGNAYGIYASYGVPDATGNVVTNNSSMNCYNVDC